MLDEKDLSLYDAEINAYLNSLDTEIFEVRFDRLYAYLFNERQMKTLEWLMSKVLDIDIKEVIGKVIFHNTRTPLLTPKEKAKYLDVFLEYNDEKFLLELNNNFDGAYIRNIIYGFNVSVNNYPVIEKDEEQEKLRDNYFKEAHKVTVINLNWHRSKELSEKVPGVTIRYLPYNENNETDYIYKLVNVNLDYFKEISYNEVDNSQKFYKLLTISNSKDLREILESERMLKEYGKRLVEYSKNERKDYMDAALDNYLRELDIRLGGKHEGLVEGRNEEKMEITMGLIKQNVSYEIISNATGLSIQEIEEIVKNNKDKN